MSSAGRGESALLLDASVWLAALDRADPQHGVARSFIEIATDGMATLAALDLTLYEVANVATVRWASPAEARRLVTLVTATCPDTLERVDEDLAREAVAIAARHRLTVYDGAYVAAGRRRGLTLVSGDLRDLVTPGLAIAPDVALSRLTR